MVCMWAGLSEKSLKRPGEKSLDRKRKIRLADRESTNRILEFWLGGEDSNLG